MFHPFLDVHTVDGAGLGDSLVITPPAFFTLVMAPSSLRTYAANRQLRDSSSSSPQLHPSIPDEQKTIAKCFAKLTTISDSSNCSREDYETARLPLPNSEDQNTSWSSFPIDIRYFILAKLDYKDLFRAKAQSKQFKALIESQEFQGWRGKAHLVEGFLTTSHFFVRNGTWHCEGYDLITKAWMMLPPFTNLPHLDPELFKDHSICVAGCLICANVGKAQESLVVFNPLTGRKRELSNLVHRRNPVLMHMIADSKENFYKIIVAGSSRLGDEHLSKTTEVFDSRTKAWKVTEELPGPLFALNEHQTGAYVNGIIYCIAFLDGDRGKGLLAYSVAEEKWLPDHTRSLPYSTSSNIVQLVESYGEVYLFSELEQQRRVEHRIDVLDRASGHWTNVMTETKVGNAGLQTYPEYTCVSFGEGKLCVYNTIEHHGVVYEVQSGRRCDTLAPPARSACGDMAFFSLNPLTFVFAPSFNGILEP